jgi:hypothetical protein
MASFDEDAFDTASFDTESFDFGAIVAAIVEYIVTFRRRRR